MLYKVKEMFRTLQGEGVHAGKVAVFVRFAGCNLWSGREGDREEQAHTNGAQCPLFCDTDFVGGASYTADELVEQVVALGAGPQVFVVLTGGEPLLQVDAPLLRALRARDIDAHVETNGTINPKPGVLAGLHWITMSPKVAPDRLKLATANEIKVVVPSYNPLVLPLDSILPSANCQCFVQPEDGPRAAANLRLCVAFVQANPRWRLGVQLHKIIGVP